jgi:hypothetical protein
MEKSESNDRTGRELEGNSQPIHQLSDLTSLYLT